MVRFKNRHLLVEFLQPASLAPSFAAAFEPRSAPPAESDSDDDEDELFPIQALPFLLPLPGEDLSQPKLKLGDEGGGVIYRSVRGIVQDVFGDEGWGRISSSFKVVYHSPLTTLTILRIARPHYRLLWSALTLLTTINNQSILPRVIAVSGTIKKLQNKSIAYHRLITARALGALAQADDDGLKKEERRRRAEIGWEKEIGTLKELEDA